MTDVAPEQTTEDEQSWSGAQPAPAVTYPEYGPLPEARFSVNFTPGKAPMLTVRAHDASGLTAALQELEDANAFNVIGLTHTNLGAQVAVGAGLGPATQIPAAPAAPQAPTPPPFGPNVSVPGAPGFQGNPGFPPAAAPGGFPAPQGGFDGGQQQNSRGPKPRPADWPQVYKIDVPFQMKDQFKQFREQHKDVLKGKVQWAGGGNYWVHGEVAQGFAAYNPVPA